MQTDKPLKLTVALGGVITCASTSAMAYESGSPGSRQPAGRFIAATAAASGPGIYMFDQRLTYQAMVVGPDAPLVNGRSWPV
jgi:hypothetical protein